MGEDRGVEEMEKAVNDKVDSKKLKPKKKLWLIVGLIVIILAVVGGGWYYLSAKDESETKEEAKTENTAATTSDSNSTSTTSTATDETAGWKTYTSTELGISFKYPESWGTPKTVSLDYSSNHEAGGDGKQFVINFDGKTYWSINGYTPDFRYYASGSVYRGENSNLDLPEVGPSIDVDNFVKKVTIDNQKTYYKGKFSYDDMGGARMMLTAYLNGKTDYKGIEITHRFQSVEDSLLEGFGPATGGDWDTKINIAGKRELVAIAQGSSSDATALSEYKDYQAWLSTFQFTNPTADWKTYTNSDYGFSFKYPKDWTAENNENNSIGASFAWSVDDGDMYDGIQLEIFNIGGDGAMNGSRQKAIATTTIIINGATWTRLVISQDDIEHIPASIAYITNRDGKTYWVLGQERAGKQQVDNLMNTFQFTM